MYIQEFMCEKTTDALREAHIHGMTVVQGMGFGKQSDEESHNYIDKTVCAGFSRKMKLEIVCADDEEEAASNIIQAAAHTGKYGDGKIFVSNVCKAMDIRTGAIGENVLESFLLVTCTGNAYYLM